MATITHNPDRDITPEYLATVSRWINATGEVLVVMRYLCGAGAKDFALVRTEEKFRKLIEVCPDGTDIIVFRDRQLPLRGIVDEKFIKLAKDQFHAESECLLIRIGSERPNNPRCVGFFDYFQDLEENLKESIGDNVALGICPDFNVPDNAAMISASKGGIDGPR